MCYEMHKLRDAGVLRTALVSSYQETLSKTLEKIGLFNDEELLNVIDKELAHDVVARILWKDLAYNVELMPKDKAYEFSDKILTQYYTDECTIFSNSQWEEKDNENVRLIGFNSMTNATFDSGIIIKHPNYCFCIWVEDED